MKFYSVSSLSEVQRVVNRGLEINQPYAMDLETTGINPWRDKIVGVALSFSEAGSVYIPLRHKYGQPFNAKSALQMLKPLFENVPSLIYNVPFEAEFLFREDIFLNKESVDVALLAYTNGTEIVNKLSSVAKNLLKFEVWDYKKFMAGLNCAVKVTDISHAPIDSVAEYCGRDTIATYLLWKLLYPILKNNDVYKMEARLLPITIRMRRNGVLIDRKYLESEALRIADLREHVQNIIWSQASSLIGEPVTFNIGSWQQVGDIVYNRIGLPVYNRTEKTGAASTSGDAFSRLKWDNPVVYNIGTWRGLNKNLGSYAQKFPDMIENDGRIHASFNQSGVGAGRYSSSDPNLQNIPGYQEWFVKDVDNTIIKVNTRKAFIVPEGWGWFSYDYSQIEARIAAGVTKESILLNAFRDGVDFHTKTASLVFGVPVEKVTKSQRQMGKKLNFLLLYGGTEKKLYSELIKEISVTPAECKRYKELYYNAYPKMFSEATRIAKDAYMTHSITTIDGRVVPIPLLGHYDKKERAKGERQAYNGVIQGSAAGVLKKSMIEMDDMISKNYGHQNVKNILTVHDSQDYEVSPEVKKDAEGFHRDALSTLRFTMEGFPALFAEASEGVCWGELVELKNGVVPEKKVMVSVPGKPKTFVLCVPDITIVKRTKHELEELKRYIRSKSGYNNLIIKVNERDIYIEKCGISIEDKNKLVLMTSGQFYEQPDEEDLKEL